ncbi:MAG TPA: hypothetical protein VLA49_15545 [Anaerolineales bacterium]|nr:hypothetical protein [Anaerolineales bacterium]
MQIDLRRQIQSSSVHNWLQTITIAYLPGPTTPLLDGFTSRLLSRFRHWGHTVVAAPEGQVDILLTTAAYGEPVSWRRAPIFTARKRFQLERAPTLFTLVHINPAQLGEILAHFEGALEKETPDPADYDFPGLASEAYKTLHEQGRRGGPILSLVRLLQSQTMSIRLLLVIGDERPVEAYTFDLVGAHPRSLASTGEAFYDDLVLRMVTAVSTREVTDHQVVGEPVPAGLWRTLSTPAAMREAGRQLGLRGFFTEMVNVAHLVNVPAVPETVASQYSEGCFATWDAVLGALVATVTGSARPVQKYNLGDDDLAVIVGVRPDRQGALVRQVQGKRNIKPSSEAVEMIQMDGSLPRLKLEPGWLGGNGVNAQRELEVPVLRSKLHGHRGVSSYDPRKVEHVPLDSPYYHYPVSCATEAQASAIVAAFSRSEALANPADPRQLVFTVLPGHGLVIAEKWARGKAPFQLIWEAMDAGALQISSKVPQGLFAYQPDRQGRLVLYEP